MLSRRTKRGVRGAIERSTFNVTPLFSKCQDCQNLFTSYIKNVHFQSIISVRSGGPLSRAAFLCEILRDYSKFYTGEGLKSVQIHWVL